MAGVSKICGSTANVVSQIPGSTKLPLFRGSASAREPGTHKPQLLDARREANVSGSQPRPSGCPEMNDNSQMTPGRGGSSERSDQLAKNSIDHRLPGHLPCVTQLHMS